MYGHFIFDLEYCTRNNCPPFITLRSFCFCIMLLCDRNTVLFLFKHYFCNSHFDEEKNIICVQTFFCHIHFKHEIKIDITCLVFLSKIIRHSINTKLSKCAFYVIKMLIYALFYLDFCHLKKCLQKVFVKSRNLVIVNDIIRFKFVRMYSTLYSA